MGVFVFCGRAPGAGTASICRIFGLSQLFDRAGAAEGGSHHAPLQTLRRPEEKQRFSAAQLFFQLRLEGFQYLPVAQVVHAGEGPQQAH